MEAESAAHITLSSALERSDSGRGRSKSRRSDVIGTEPHNLSSPAHNFVPHAALRAERDEVRGEGSRARLSANRPTRMSRPMPTATARHILVPTEEKCLELKQQIEGGADFADLAKEHSKCPSGKSGGDLGSFGPGQMVKEFDTVVFNEAVGEVHGPVKTQFGYHLLEITSRS